MTVGNDPFPNDEVTGLAAFENLPPVSSISATDDDAEAPASDTAHVPTISQVSAVARVAVAADATPAPTPKRARQRRDPTLQQIGGSPWRPGESGVEYGYSQSAPSQPPSGADHLFDDSAQGPWDDEATRVASSAGMLEAMASDPAGTGLHMEWNEEEEPPTQMQPGAMFGVAAIADSDSANDDWEAGEEGTQVYDRAILGAPASTGDFGDLASQTMSGGRPSPFPMLPPSPPRAAVGIQPDADFGRGFEAPLPDRFLVALRGGHRPAWLLLGSVAFGFLVLVLILRSLHGASASLASASVTVNPGDAQLALDGKQAPGTSSPYVLSALTPGSHTIVATKPGYGEYRGTFVVEPGETKTLPAIELARSEVGFFVRSTPPAAAIWLDGTSVDQATPARLLNITPGIHRLQLKHEGYSDYELQLFVPDATVLQLPVAELTALPPPAEPVPTAGREKGRSARAARNADDDEADDDEDSDTRSRSRWTHARSSRSSRDQDSNAAPVMSAAAASAPFASSSNRMGTLRINTRPWSQVVVDGRIIGNTPQQGIPLTAGSHRVQLVNAQMGMSKTVTVKVIAGQIVTQVLNLAD